MELFAAITVMIFILMLKWEVGMMMMMMMIW
jgi:hypothetical protein